MLVGPSDDVSLNSPGSPVHCPDLGDELAVDDFVCLATSLSDTSNRFQSERCKDNDPSVVCSSLCNLRVSSRQKARFLTPMSTLRILQGEAERPGLFERSASVRHTWAFVPVELRPVRNARCLSCHAFRLDSTVRGSTLVMLVERGWLLCCRIQTKQINNDSASKLKTRTREWISVRWPKNNLTCSDEVGKKYAVVSHTVDVASRTKTKRPQPEIESGTSCNFG